MDWNTLVFGLNSEQGSVFAVLLWSWADLSGCGDMGPDDRNLDGIDWNILVFESKSEQWNVLALLSWNWSRDRMKMSILKG
jgi:hypothetical protein